ncbi:cystathionine gamma-synthase [Luteibacter rhizovicinus]|uniref:L-methionine gamma-lyase n=1 Tax=Luteibacter rhizovicinus TaxID=242606 RepID=A0A4R3YT55_9GAMM|nr:cystathionine gamma-synthase [Luteibacter rhizovicinus]TCV95701.1 cystathionine gamma-synthase [Luteibacter rhizovicinus]
MTDSRLCTRAVRAGIESDTQHGAVVPPLHLSTNYAFEGFGRKRAYDYSRSGNPTRDLLGDALTELEEGAGAVVTGSGMSAVALALELVPAGALVLAAHDCYGGTWRLLDAWAKKGRFQVRFVDFTDPAALADGLAAKPALVWIETPSNPLLRITDVRHVSQAAHAAGALVVVDNTFLSPALQQPLKLGADLVVHSTTKYINGHSDVVGGAVIARDPAVAEQLKWWGNCNGLTGSPFDSFLTLRGVRTLAVRLRAHEENAHRIAERLDGHSAVSRVFYPGLASHPGHALAARQQLGFGAMLSFEIAGGVEAIEAFVDGLHYFSLAESLGGVESLVAHPATMTHASMAPEARLVAGISDSLLRLSVGIEDGDDLLADLDAALERAARVAAPKRKVGA